MMHTGGTVLYADPTGTRLAKARNVAAGISTAGALRTFANVAVMPECSDEPLYCLIITIFPDVAAMKTILTEAESP